MKCPVCAAECRDAAFCPACGFDPAQDYESYPSLMPLEGAKPLSALRSGWQARNRDLLRCPACGGRTFSFHSGERSVICASCGRPLEKDVLSPFFSQHAPAKVPSVIQDPSLPFSYDDGTRTLTVRGQGPMKNYTLNRAPWSRYRSLIAHIVIEKGVTTVGSRAFADCFRLLTVRLPEGLISIERNAFSGCTELKSIDFPESLREIGSYAFESCSSLTEVRIPARVSLLGYASFYGCSSLTRLKIAPSMIEIADFAFYGCPLHSVSYSGKKKIWDAITAHRGIDNLGRASVTFDES